MSGSIGGSPLSGGSIGGTPGATDWAKVAELTNKFTGGLTGMGGGGSGANDDSKWLRIGASAAPFTPGNGNLANLLQTLIQMHHNAGLANMQGAATMGGGGRGPSLL